MIYKKFDIIAIGFGPASVVATSLAKKLYKNKKVAIITKKGTPVVPCAIPYMNFTLKPEENILPHDIVKNQGITVIEDEITAINSNNKTIKGKSGKEYAYDKLIIATGSKPMHLPIPGIEKKHIYPIIKKYEHLKWLRKDLENAKDVVVIGASFAGIEIVDELSKTKKHNITVIEILPDVIYHAFDKEIRKEIRTRLEKQGVKFVFNEKVVEFMGDEVVKEVRLSNNKIIKADIVILAAGALPNSDLAKASGIELNEFGFIKVDKFQETNVKDIFAIGDVAEKIDFFTGKPSKLMLATIACEEARIAALNLYKKRIAKQNIIPVYSTVVQDYAFANAGLTEDLASRLNIEYILGRIATVDKHPATLPNSSKIAGKMLFTKQGVLIGVQLYGSMNVGEIINIASLMIQNQAHVDEIINEKLSTQPKLTAAPTAYPLIQGAIDAFTKLK